MTLEKLNLNKKNFLKLICLLCLLHNFFTSYLLQYKNIPKKFNHIHIAMSFNNNYTYIIMVSITSILLNAKISTFIHFHFLIGNDVELINIKKICSIKKLNSNTIFNFYRVGNTFKGWKHGKQKLTVASFYRMILGEIINDVNKIIYLDGDTLIYNDLTEMYDLNMNNLYFRGIHEILSSEIMAQYKKDKYICAGIMLMNLELIREEHVFTKFKEYYLRFYNQGIYYGDQHIINSLFSDKIGFLPPIYGMWFINEKSIMEYKELNPLIYTEQELRESQSKPAIRHIWGDSEEGFLNEKPWLLLKYFKIKEEWNYYAKKTGYYPSICKFYKNACINIHKI